MSRATWPNWIRRAYDDHFNVIAKLASEHAEVDILRQKLNRITDRLRIELTPEQYQLVLEWESALNFALTVEREFLYQRGVQDGMVIMKEFSSFMTEDV